MRVGVVLGFDQWVDLLVGVMKVCLGCICNTFQFVKSLVRPRSKERKMRCDNSNVVCVGIVYIYIYETVEARREEWS